MARSRRGGGDPFFEGFRTALGEAPAGLLRPGPAATEADVAAAAAALGRPLPRELAAFLRSFDGAELFDEATVIHGVTPAGPAGERPLVEANRPPRPPLTRPGELVFAETAAGDRFLLAPPREDDGAGPVFRLRGDGEERWLAGSSFARWLDALVARELLLYGPDGEFLLEAFEEDGEELTPRFALRQAERALRKDPGSAESHHDLGVAHRRLGRLPRAREAFARAAELDPDNPWPHFDLGRTALALDDPAGAVAAFRAAAAAAAPAAAPTAAATAAAPSGPAPAREGARFLAWAARAARQAGDAPEADRARQEAERRHPALLAELERAASAARAADDPEALAEAVALVEALTPPRRRLPVVQE